MADGGITLKTFGDLLTHGYKLSGHCRRCGVHRDIDLAKCPTDRDYVRASFRCRNCGGMVEITLSQISTSKYSHLPAIEKWRRGQV
jgi:transcription elongation factor Elf1